jgi:uncharacterized protein YciI
MRLLLPLLLLAACAAPAADAPAAASRDYVLVFLIRAEGEPTEAAMAGHFENMGRLAREGQLLVAGPFGRENPEPAMRGLFIFDVPTVAQAEALTATDPSVQAKVFRMEAHELSTGADLRGVLARSLAAEEARKAAGITEMTAGMRSYVIAIADAGRAGPKLDGDPRTFISGRLGGEHSGRGLWILDAKDLAEGQAIVGELGDLGGVRLLPWFGTDEVAALGAR